MLPLSQCELGRCEIVVNIFHELDLRSYLRKSKVAGKAPSRYSVQGYLTAKFVLASHTMVNLTGLKTTATIPW